MEDLKISTGSEWKRGYVLEMDTTFHGGITDLAHIDAKKMANGRKSRSPKVTYRLQRHFWSRAVKFPNSNEVGQIFGSLSTGGMHREGFSDSGTVSTKETGVSCCLDRKRAHT